MALGSFNTSVSGTRKAGGSYLKGVWVGEQPVALTIHASIQPASEREMKLLPEGRRIDGAYALRSKAEIREGDVFILDGEAHEVVKVQRWRNGVIPHFMGLAVREQKV